MESVCGRGAHIHANRVLALIRKIFNFAIERDWLQTNPCQMIKAPAKNVQRDRLLTEDEIAKFWEATKQEQHPELQSAGCARPASAHPASPPKLVEALAGSPVVRLRGSRRCRKTILTQHDGKRGGYANFGTAVGVPLALPWTCATAHLHHLGRCWAMTAT